MDDTPLKNVIMKTLLSCCDMEGHYVVSLEKRWENLQGCLRFSTEDLTVLAGGPHVVSVSTAPQCPSENREAAGEFHLGYVATMHLRDHAWSAKLWHYHPSRRGDPDIDSARAIIGAINHMASCVVNGDWGLAKSNGTDLPALWRSMQSNLEKAAWLTWHEPPPKVEDTPL